MAALPDFGAPVSGATFLGFAAHGGTETLLLPSSLEVAARPDGQPDFTLALVRRPARAPGAGGEGDPGYGVLDLRLAPAYPLDAALRELRQGHSNATVAPATLGAGFLRLLPAAAGAALPPELLEPTPIGWESALPAHWNIRLALDTAELLRGALAAGTLLADARIEAEIVGIAPRLPVAVRFDPEAVLASLRREATPERRIARSALLGWLLRPPAELPLTIDGDLPAASRQSFAEAMADRLRERLLRFVPGPATPGEATYELPPAPGGGSGRSVPIDQITWDLRQEVRVPRPWIVTLDPFAAASAALGAGVEAVVRQVSLPPLAVGFHEVTVSANLPPAREGVLALGVTLRLPPNPPFRPAAIVETVEIAAPLDGGGARFRLAPGEPLRYTATPFAVLAAAQGIQQLDGAPQPREGDWLALDIDDFPLDWVGLSLTPVLAARADLAGTLTYGSGGASEVVSEARASLPFALSAARPGVALALPRGSMSPELAAVFTERGTEPAAEARTLTLGPLPATGRTFDLTSFPEYGPHRIAVSAPFPDDPPGGAERSLVVVDLIAEADDPSQPDAITTLALTPAASAKEWGYVADSPFRAGYRYRLGGAEAGRWSGVRSPFEPLALDTETEMKTDPAAATPSVAFDVSGVHLYAAGGEPGILRYVPGAPSPERNPDGRPTVLLIASDRGALLQLGAHWGLSAEEKSELRRAVAAGHPELAGADLQPAPVAVRGVTLSLADAGGTFQPLKTSTSSGMPPYSAIFSAQLDAAQKAQAMAALGGRRELLVVDYEIALPETVAATFGAPPATRRRADVATWIAAGDLTRHLLLSPATL